MKIKSIIKSIGMFTALLLAISTNPGAARQVDSSQWQRQEVNWRMSNGSRVKAIKYPKEKPLLTLDLKKTISEETTDEVLILQEHVATLTSATIISSPPVDGFVPWIVVFATDSRQGEFQLEAVPTTTIDGSYPGGSDPQTDYAIGIFDTGASTHIMDNASAVRAGLFANNPSLVTSNQIQLTGVTGPVDAWVSQPLGIYMDGLGAIDLGEMTDFVDIVGQTNTSIIVGMAGDNLPTVVGTPMAVYYTTVIDNSSILTVSRDSNDFTGPSIKFYEAGDSRIPKYSQIIPLELKPLGGTSVQYVPQLDLISFFEDPINIDFGTPQTPSVVMGNLSQSTFFIHSVDLVDGGNAATDKNRFMLDTGAQVSVIGSRIGARLGLNPAAPEFVVEIEGANGEVADVNGFYIDSLNIPALGQWLQFTNIPVILLDIFSPEGGTLDGIIGMNLFTEFNMVLHGGGLFLQEDPRLELQRIGLIADIAPDGGDGVVDMLDLAVLAQAWLSTSLPSLSENWNALADLAPKPIVDGKIDFQDFSVLAEHWFELSNP